ncbi:MAG: hypothetical protein GX162_00480 [Firmicutes bacterium]|jgi:hypothetical protein|nr:hypothetical protein [Bacillota bacterium]
MLKGQARLGKRLKAVIVIGLAVFFVVGGCGAVQAATTQTNSTSLTLNIGEAIEVVSWPEASINLSGSAVPGEAVISGPLRFTVKCNTEWDIEVRSDEPTGKLRQFDPASGSYVNDGRTSQRALEWSLSMDDPWSPLTGTGSNIVTRQPATGEDGRQVEFFLRYRPGFDDIRLTDGHVYRIVLTYTATVGY